MYDVEILDLFNVMVVDKKTPLVLDNVKHGFVTDFRPNDSQFSILISSFRLLDSKTLFTVNERQYSDIEDLIYKQILHYVEVYGLGVPGLFNLEVDNGKIYSLVYVQGVTEDELHDKLRSILYSNAPVKDADMFAKIIKARNVDFEFNKIANNELKVALFDVNKHTFDDGDDLVRYMCYVATGDFLLIKSKEVIDLVRRTIFDSKFFDKHAYVLSQVFNRHKRIILAAKNDYNKSIFNRITRMSKRNHVPIKESIAKTFISKALNGEISDFRVLDKISIRDKFKYLNLLEYKKEQSTLDAFVIRNGKIHIKSDRKTFSKKSIDFVISKVLQSLNEDLSHLKQRSILLDSNVDYGLPVSRKQTMGNLPFGTKVTCSDTISSGVYWRSEWGADDLDLSTISLDGRRVGWGQSSGYAGTDVIYSGDLTNAYSGAMEFMTSSKYYDDIYGLFLNIYSGGVECKAELVVGNKTDDQWIDSPIIRESIELKSRGTLIGFVKSGVFTVYSGRLNSSSVSGSSKDLAIVNRGSSNFWTVGKLFDKLGITYDSVEEKEYDFDLSYNKFSYDKLENLLFS